MVKVGDGYKVTIGENTYNVKLNQGAEPAKLIVEMSSKPVAVAIREVSGERIELSLDGEDVSFQRTSATGPTPGPAATQGPAAKDTLVSPMPGRVITVVAKEGDSVRVGDPMVVIESMKMEVAIRADREGTVEEILVSEGESVRRGEALVKFRETIT